MEIHIGASQDTFLAQLYKNDERFELHEIDGNSIVMINEFEEWLNEVPVYDGNFKDRANTYIKDLIQQGYELSIKTKELLN
jgi:hypothetical protein